MMISLIVMFFVEEYRSENFHKLISGHRVWKEDGFPFFFDHK